MSNINSINNSAYLEKLLASQAGGSTQETGTANNAFAELFQSILDGTASAQSTSSTTSAASDMNALGQALASGNLSAAQLAFQSLQTDLDAARKAHHLHPHQDADITAATQTGATTGSNAVTPVASTTPSDLLNLLMSKS